MGKLDDYAMLLRWLTAGLCGSEPRSRSGDDFRALRQALGYCWSVAVAADPEPGASR